MYTVVGTCSIIMRPASTKPHRNSVESYLLVGGQLHGSFEGCDKVAYFRFSGKEHESPNGDLPKHGKPRHISAVMVYFEIRITPYIPTLASLSVTL